MSRARSTRRIDLMALPWPAAMTGTVEDGFTVTAAGAPDDVTLQAEVDGAPDFSEPPTAEGRLDDLESRVEAAAALADQANTTAQDVATAMRDGAQGRP